jgi:hypothetical protein
MFWAEPLVNQHIRGRTTEIRNAYMQLVEANDDPPFREWLAREAGSLENFRSTFSADTHAGRARRILNAASSLWGFTGVAAVAGATGISAAVLSVLNKCLCHLIGVVTLLAVVAIWLTFIYAFQRKRELFLRTQSGDANVYALEDSLFANLRRDKRAEKTFDVLGWFLVAVAFGLALVIEKFSIERGLFRNPVAVPLYSVLTGVFLVVTCVVFIQARKRTPR